jgi:hypothetical protein
VFVSCWSAKGGQGTTVVAVALATMLARQGPPGVLLVDLAGDVPAVLGQAEPTGLGLSDWLAAGAEVPPDGLARLELAVTDDLRLLVRGRGPLDPVERVEVLAGLLADEARSVVVDCGVPCWPRATADADVGPGDAAAVLAAAAVESLVVTRACYLSLRRLVAVRVRATGVVLVSESGRALGRREVEDVTGVDVVAEVAVEPAVARAVDAGLLAGRLPRGLERALGRVR